MKQVLHSLPQNAASHLETLFNLLESLFKAGSTSDVLNAIQEASINIISCMNVVIAAASEDAETNRTVLGTYGLPQNLSDLYREFPLTAREPLAEAARTRKPLYVETVDDMLTLYPDLDAAVRATGTKAGAAYPLIYRERVIGAIAWGWDQEQQFDEVQRSWMNFLAMQCAHAITQFTDYQHHLSLENQTHALRKELARTRERAEKADQANLAKDTFLAMVSHELRTPLHAVLSSTELLSHTHLTDEQQGHITIIQNNAGALLDLVGDILDTAQIEAGKFRLDPKDFALRDLIEDVVLSINPLAIAQCTELTYFIASNVPAVIHADARRIRQALINLISNAVKFTKKGHIEIEVSTHATNNSKKAWTLSFVVRDTGIGFNVAATRVMFEPFTQLDGSHIREFGGLGLGLYISRQAALRMGGDITAKPASGLGSEFTLTVQAATATTAIPAPEAPYRGKQALLYNSQGLLSQHLMQLAERSGFSVHFCRTQSGLNKTLAQGSIDLVIADLRDHADVEWLRTETMHASALKLSQIPALLIDYGMTAPSPKWLQHSLSLAPPYTEAAFRDKLRRLIKMEDPTAKQEQEQPSPTIPSASLPTRKASHTSALVVEDSLVNQKLMGAMLKRLGLSVDYANDGYEALNQVGRKDYDVIFMDIQMPNLDGFQTTRAIRNKPIRQPTIIAMTALARLQDRMECLKAGMNDYLSKPFNLKELEDTLKSAMNKHH